MSLSLDSGRVADAPSQNWVYRILPRALWPHAQLARWDRPIGWQLLMWPCFWSAALAANVAAGAGHAEPGRFVWHLLLFFVGSVAMRGAGCAYNDLVDHELDASVTRTRSRPLPAGRISRRHAKLFILVQALVGLVVLLQFNPASILLGIASLAIVAAYPFAKRVTNWPQLVLGLAFSWGALMGWSAVFAAVGLPAVALYLAAIAWTIGYDTIYAYQDREDDALVGIGSTARRFGERPKPWLTALYGAALLFMLVAYATAGVGILAYLGLLAAAVVLAYQIVALRIHDATQCLALFRTNNIVGLIIFLGLVAGWIVRAI